MVSFIIKYWLEFIFGLIICFIGFVFKKFKFLYQTIENTKSSICVLLKNEILKQYLILKQKKEINIYDKEIINDLYVEYKKLGGNSFIEDIINDIFINESGGD